MDVPPRKPWWKRKRWIAAIALWLALPVLYPFSVGPAEYAVQRGWVYSSVVAPYYRPLRWAMRGRRVPWFAAYVSKWRELGDRHGRAASL